MRTEENGIKQLVSYNEKLQVHKACAFIADMDRGKIHNCISSSHKC